MIDEPEKSKCFWVWIQTNNKTKFIWPSYKRKISAKYLGWDTVNYSIGDFADGI